MTDDMQRLLVFNVGGSRYALELQEIAEVLDAPASYPVPWASGAIRGAMNFHGSLVSLLDLAEFLDLGAAAPAGVVLVLDKRIANLALMADGVETIVPADTFLDVAESDDPMVDKVYLTADGEIRLLAAEKILERIESSLRG